MGEFEGKKFLGAIHINNNCIVSDPCYEFPIWCNYQIKDMVPGAYDCYSYIVRYDNNERRVAAIEIKLANNGLDYDPNYKRLESVDIAVDSGSCGFFPRDTGLSKDEFDNVYEMLIKSQMTSGCAIIPGIGFAAFSGFGDGCYELSVAKNKDGKVDAARIIFIDPDDWKSE